MERRRKSEIDAQLELIIMLKQQVHTPSTGTPDNTPTTGTPDTSVGQINNDPPLPSSSQGLDMHTRSVNTVSVNDTHHSDACQSVCSTCLVQHTDLPPPPSMFDGKVQDNGDAFNRWSRKLLCYAELQ